MSTDYYIYLKQIDQFSVKSFNQYCDSIGLCVAIHPAFDIFGESGFIPIRFVDKRFSKAGENFDFVSGFEFSLSEYHYIMQPQEEPKSIFRKLFPKKQKEETAFDRAIKDSTMMAAVSCRSVDSFEVLLAHVFGAYLVKYCGAIFDDPQTGQFYDNSNWLETEIAAILDELSQQAAASGLVTHQFKVWENIISAADEGIAPASPSPSISPFCDNRQ